MKGPPDAAAMLRQRLTSLLRQRGRKAQLARDVGVSQSQITAWLKGEKGHDPALDKIGPIAFSCGVTVSALFDDEQNSDQAIGPGLAQGPMDAAENLKIRQLTKERDQHKRALSKIQTISTQQLGGRRDLQEPPRVTKTESRRRPVRARAHKKVAS